MSAFTQNMMTANGKEKMFATWKKYAPKNPKRGWFGSLYWEDGQYKCPIEDYNEDGTIETLGSARLNEDGTFYREDYY